MNHVLEELVQNIAMFAKLTGASAHETHKRGFSQRSRCWYIEEFPLDANVVDEFSVGFVDEVGYAGDISLQIKYLTPSSYKSLELSIGNRHFDSLLYMSDLLVALTTSLPPFDVSPEDVFNILLGLGFEDVTPTTDPRGTWLGFEDVTPTTDPRGT